MCRMLDARLKRVLTSFVNGVPSEIEYIFSFVRFRENKSIQKRGNTENVAASKNILVFLLHKNKTLSNFLSDFSYLINSMKFSKYIYFTA
jgi:hypothetical protein